MHGLYGLAWEEAQCPFHSPLLVGAVTTLPRLKSRRIRLDGERQGHFGDEHIWWEITLEIVTWHQLQFNITGIVFLKHCSCLILKVVILKHSESFCSWRHQYSRDNRGFPNYLGGKKCIVIVSFSFKWFQFQLSPKATLGKQSKMEALYF